MADKELKEKTEEIKEAVGEKTEEIKEAVGDKTEEIKDAVGEKTEEIKEAVGEKTEEIKEAVGEKTEEIKDAVEDKTEEIKEAVEEKAEKAAAVNGAVQMKASTEANRRKKAERREAKAARKEANKAEEKKNRPNNIILAILIFGVLAAMFAFVKGYNYFSKPANIEEYLEEQGLSEAYTDIPVSESTTMKMRADGNTVKIWLTIDEDASEEELEQYQGDDGTKTLEQMGAYFLTSLKPYTRGFGATVKVKVSQGDETVNFVKLSYSEAKKVAKEAEEEAAEAAEEDSDVDADADVETEEATDSSSEDATEESTQDAGGDAAETDGE